MVTEKEAEIRHENSGLVVSYDAGIFQEYQKKVLASGEIGCFLKMEFVNIEGNDVVTYNISGLTSLAKHTFNSLYDMMGFLEEVLSACAHADEFLIDIGNICMKSDYIFIEARRNQLKFFYKPTKYPCNWQQSFRELVDDINKSLLSRDVKIYFELLIDFIDGNDRTMEDMVLKISDLKRDSHMCGIR